jgi:hypothetical protein
MEEWRQLLNGQVLEVERIDGTARLRLRDGDAAVLTATDLARREKACCPFFDFRLALLAEATWLEIEAPAEAASILDGLVDLRRD